jgi:hypothetical protein
MSVPRAPLRTPSRGKVIVSGILFFFPLAGVTYQFLHYLIALRRLGYDPYYVEDSARWIYDPRSNDISGDASGNVAAVALQLEKFGFGDRWCFRGCYEGGQCYGLSERELAELYRDADVLLNVTGSQELREEHLRVKRRVYVESDPFPVQVRAAAGDPKTVEQLSLHHVLFSFGENLGAPDCSAPPSSFSFLPTRQPVLLDLWQPTPPRERGAYCTIATWHNKGKHIEYQGETYYWTKDREFLKYIELPTLRDVPFELATDVGAPTRQLLERNRWRLRSSLEVSRDLDSYRSYIASARGEFTVARDQYVRPRTGWFSDRTACYLAAGRPVITQETGFSKFLPTGAGLYAFRDMAEALAAVDAVEANYERACRGALDVAAECFAAEKVVADLLARAGVG